MNKVFVVYNGSSYSRHMSTDGGEYVYSTDPTVLGQGFEIEGDGLNRTYRKFIPNDDIEAIYSIRDTVLFEGREFDIVKSSDDNFDQPDSYVCIYTDDVDLLKEHQLWEDAEVMETHYGHLWYMSAKIPVEKVTILRRRKYIDI